MENKTMFSTDEALNDLKNDMDSNEVYFDEGFIVLETISPTVQKFEIDINQCNTPDRILSMVLHLSEKSWITPVKINKFIVIAAGRAGLDLHL